MTTAVSGVDVRLQSLVGGKTATKLKDHLELYTAEDLLRHYPRRYARRGQLTDLSALPLNEHVTVLARVVEAALRDYRDNGGRLKKRLEVVVTDGEGTLLLTFFHGAAYRARSLRPGAVGLFAGKVGQFRNRRQLLHPDYELLDSSSAAEPETGTDTPADTDRDLTTLGRFGRSLIPVYPATAKVSSWQIARCVEIVLDGLAELEDPLPGDVREGERLIGLRQAYEGIHRPADEAALEAARARLRFEEAFVVQTVLAQHRTALEAMPAVPRLLRGGGLRERFESRLPFTLTTGQIEIGETLAAELAQRHPMHRLLQGEVGSGKTVVALRAMLQVVDAGGQAALLAPTEVLAAQHHRSITALLGDLALGGMLGGAEGSTRVRLLTGSLGAAARRAALLDAAAGAAGIVVGTHALLEDRVQFADLGLVVVDEQHRFGVEQRAALTGKGDQVRPHVLVMTATPIPRTVAMTVFGDLETSTLRELPAGRQPVQTTVVPATDRPAWLDRIWGRIREEASRGRQAYVVCSRIGDGGAEEAGGPGDEVDAPGRRRSRSAVEAHRELSDGPLSGLRVELLHGRMAADAKDEVMRRFAAGEVDVLVATTVIEVGVDVSNASVMVVMDAERFGLSQLHQLRGRVGRGDVPGLCLLVTTALPDSPALQRLVSVAATADGFAISRLDLAQRREGDVLGASQSGRRSSLRLLSALEHEDVIAAARQAATRTVAEDPRLMEHIPLAAAVFRLEETQQADYLDKA